MQRDADDQGRRIHDLGDLAVAVTFEIAEREHLPRCVAQFRHCFANQLSQFLIFVMCFRILL